VPLKLSLTQAIRENASITNLFQENDIQNLETFILQIMDFANLSYEEDILYHTNI